DQPATGGVIVPEGPLGDLAGVNQVSLCSDEPVDQIAEGEPLGISGGRGSAGLQVLALALPLCQRPVGIAPRAEVVHLAANFLGPAPRCMREQREIRRRLLWLAVGGRFVRLNHCVPFSSEGSDTRHPEAATSRVSLFT